jgi:hypothetical protein
MITTRNAINRLVVETADSATAIASPDTVSAGQMLISFMARTPAGRGVAMQDSTTRAVFDTVGTYLGTNSALELVLLQVWDRRAFRDRTGLASHPRIAELSLMLSASSAASRSHYHVAGFDRARVDAIANRIEAFGKSAASWRAPEYGDRARIAVKSLALLLLPMALALRHRRGSWLLYPVSVALFVTSYLFPFAVIFNSLVIAGTR